MNETLSWLIPIAPLVAAIVCAALAKTPAGKMTHWICWIGLGISAIVATSSFLSFHHDHPETIVAGYNWLTVGDMQIDLKLRFDALSLVHVTVVTVVAFFVAVYSSGYMHGDGGYGRYFAVFSGFVFCMTMLVLANNLLVLYAFWEGVGLCSYLLIGFWFQKESAAKAAFKAFLVNRIADCGFLFGILFLWYSIGEVNDKVSGVGLLDFNVIFESIPSLSSQTLGFVGFLLLLGAIGKSAQFPLHVWLPDAMEGPTPVSALIHAATMVTAGVYLMARMSPLMIEAPAVLETCAWLGGITAFLAACIALFQNDLKRVLAYSTVSQLGYMFMAIGCGISEDLVGVAVVAAMFHLATHAFFKGLLFLAAGNVMHSMGNVIDMRKFGGLKKALPTTHILFAIGAAALAGLPPLSGFWSKDGILHLLSEVANHSDHAGSYGALLIIGFITALMTAIYTFRAYFRTFHGEEHFPHEAGHHPHESPWSMLGPMVPLAIGSVLLGVAIGPTHWLGHYLDHVMELPSATEHHGNGGWWVMAISAVLGIAGVGIAYTTTIGKRSAKTDSQSIPGVVKLCRDRFYLDEAYRFLFVLPLELLAAALAYFDIQIVDRLWVLVSSVPHLMGRESRKWQNGVLTTYAVAFVVGIVVLVAIATFLSR